MRPPVHRPGAERGVPGSRVAAGRAGADQRGRAIDPRGRHRPDKWPTRGPFSSPPPACALDRDHTWISQLQVRTSSPASDQLDAAVAAGATAVGVFHRQVSVGEIPDLASCDGVTPPPSVVDQWLHYGPLLVPGRASGPGPAATATLTLPAGGLVTRHGSVAVTLYFAQAGPLIIDLPVDRA